MRASVLRNGEMVLADIDDPVPRPGQVLVDTVACGICGSDLHFRLHGPRMVELSREGGGTGTLDLHRDVVLGHEFVGVIRDLGPNPMTTAQIGELVVAMPVMITSFEQPMAFDALGFSNTFNGGYAERMLLSGPLVLSVPNGLDADHAALTEPMAVGLHAVNKSSITTNEIAVVYGCGPVGLAVIAALKLRGVDAIVAADFSPARRRLAEIMGAAEVVDPANEHPMDTALRVGAGREAVQFEAVGVPGVLNDLFRRAGKGGRIVVVGACMEADSIQPIWGINKELNVQFVLGYSPEEFSQSLHAIAEGTIAVSPLITGRVGIEGVAQAFADLASPERHAKILVKPGFT